MNHAKTTLGIPLMGPDPRQEFFYFTDNGGVAAMRFRDWKLVFSEQRGTALGAWQEPMIPLSFPKLYNLRTDPFETADFNSNSYDQWAFDRTFVGAIAQATARNFFRSLLEFPPQQAASSFNPEVILQRIQSNNN